MSDTLETLTRQSMLDRINADFNTNLSLTDVTFGTPTMVDPTVIDMDDPTQRNSAVMITTTSNVGPKLNVNLGYNRLDLARLVQLRPLTLATLGVASAHDVLSALNARWGVVLTSSDLDDIPVTTFNGGPALVLRASANSFVLIGEVIVSLGAGTGPGGGDPGDGGGGDPTDPTLFDGGFFIASSMRSFLANPFDAEIQVVDEYAPTSFDRVHSGDNGELYALTRSDWDGSMQLRYSPNQGQTWEAYDYPELDYGTHSAFFKGSLFVYAAKTAEWSQRRLMRMTPDFGYESSLELPWNVAIDGITTDGVTLTVVDTAKNLHHTTDGVNWTQEAMPRPFGDPTYNASRVSVRYAGGKLVGSLRVDSGTIWNDWAIFVRENDGNYTWRWFTGYTVIENQFDINRTSSLEGDGGFFAVGSTLFMMFDSDNGNNGSWTAASRGDIWRSTDFGVTWTMVHQNTGMEVPQAAANAGKILVCGRQVDTNGNWAAVSTDDGQSWSFDSNVSSFFGETRTDTPVPAARKNIGAVYPTFEPIPYGARELYDMPFRTSTGQISKIIYGPNGDIFVAGDTYNSGSDYSREGLTKYDPQGNLSSFNAQIQRAGLLNVMTVTDMAISGTNTDLIIAGNFNTVRGQSVDGIALINWGDATLNTNFQQPNWTTYQGNGPTIHCVSPTDGADFFVGGNFTTVNGETHRGIVRFAADGSINPMFNSALTNVNDPARFAVKKLHALHVSKLLVTGDFDQGEDGDLGTSSTVMLEGDGSIDTSFLLTAGHVETVVVEQNTAFNFTITLFGFGLVWNGQAPRNALRISYEAGQGYVADTFNVPMSTVTSAVVLSNGYYCLAGNFYRHEGYMHDGMTFVDTDGVEVDYTNLEGLAPKQLAVRDDVIVVGGEFYNVYQFDYPRPRGVTRTHLARFKPIGLGGAGDGDGGGGGENPPVEGAFGFFLSQFQQAATTTDLTTMTASYPAPYLSASEGGSQVVAGNRNDIYALQTRSESMYVGYSDNGGESFSVLDFAISDLRLAGERAVFFKGNVYFMAYDSSGVLPVRWLCRLEAGVDQGEVVDFTVNKVLELDSSSGHAIGVSGDKIVVSESHGKVVGGPRDGSSTGFLHVSTDGVNWTPTAYYHPFGDINNANDLPFFNIETVTFSGDTMLAFGMFWSCTSGPEFGPGMMIQGPDDLEPTFKRLNMDQASRGIGGEGLWEYWGIEVHVLPSGRLLVGFGDTYDYDDDSENNFVGDVWTSDDLGDTWTLRASNTGIQSGRFHYDGAILLFTGYLDGWTGGTNWMAYSTDEGQTWSYDNDPTSIFGEVQSDGGGEAVYAVARRPVTDEHFDTSQNWYHWPSDIPYAMNQLQERPHIVGWFNPPRTKSIFGGPSDTYYALGSFSAVKGGWEMGDPSRYNIARFYSSGDVDTGFDPGYCDGEFTDGIAHADGSVTVIGTFTTLHGESTFSGIGRLDAGGYIDPSFTPPVIKGSSYQDINLGGIVHAGGNNGAFFVYGGPYNPSPFGMVNDTYCRGMARINFDGTLDTTFNMQLVGESVEYVHALTYSQVLVSGPFSGTGIGMLRSDGSINPDFPSLGPNARISAILQNYGNYTSEDAKWFIIFGYSMEYDGQTYSALKFVADGIGDSATFTVDTSFNLSVGGNVSEAVELVAPGSFITDGGEIILFGSFNNINGTPINRPMVTIDWATGELMGDQPSLRMANFVHLNCGYMVTHNRVALGGDFNWARAGEYPRAGTEVRNSLLAYDLWAESLQ